MTDVSCLLFGCSAVGTAVNWVLISCSVVNGCDVNWVFIGCSAVLTAVNCVIQL